MPRSGFYVWYERYPAEDVKGLAERPLQRRQLWNRIPEPVRQEIVELALARPTEAARQLACTAAFMRSPAEPPSRTR